MPPALTAICRRSLPLRPPRHCPPAAWGPPSRVRRSRPRGGGEGGGRLGRLKVPSLAPNPRGQGFPQRAGPERREGKSFITHPFPGFFVKVSSPSSDYSHYFVLTGECIFLPLGSPLTPPQYGRTSYSPVASRLPSPATWLLEIAIWRISQTLRFHISPGCGGFLLRGL